jgi:nitronate monooxygenase
MAWPDARLLDLFGVELPIVQAPMANSSGVDMAVAVAEAGGLGSFPCAGLSDDKVREGVEAIRSRTRKPINLNFFCHDEPARDLAREAAWLERLAPYYRELGVEMPTPPLKATIYRFTEATCRVVEDLRPEVVSFHFGLPAPELVQRVKRAGCKIVCSEAGGHRGMFLETEIATQIGTFALVQQIVAAVKVPVIAAGGIGDAHGIAGAFALGAAGVQIGTAYLCTPEATTSALHKAALAEPGRETVIADVLSGRPARGVLNRFIREQGPINPAHPAYPLATPALAPLRKAAEAKGSGDFSWFWSGQGAPPPTGLGAGQLTRKLADEALALLG